ncbi:MAG: endonuclease/exonuclease/phosphatase family protein [Bdellovibrionota bacterium]
MRVLSFNIHKGFSPGNIKFVLPEIREGIRSTDADLVLLQEVHGHQSPRWFASQFEFLADEVWPHFAYGRNAVYQSGHHGNAILSKIPIVGFENIDVSPSRFERRGILHAELEGQLHVICTHLALFEVHRSRQLRILAERIRQKVPDSAKLIVGGDFNDWRQLARDILGRELGLADVHETLHGRYAATFPALMPALRLDRIYCRGLDPLSAQVLRGGVWNLLSDHLPVLADVG